MTTEDATVTPPAAAPPAARPPEVAAPRRGLARQSTIYRDGVSGVAPVVPADFAELERRAKRASSARAWAYVAGGAGEGRTMRRNRAAFDRWAIVPRMARGTTTADLSVDLLGVRRAHPLLLAPVGAGALMRRDSDLMIGRAAAATGTPYVFSNQGCSSMEAVAAAMDETSGGAPRWFQLYWSKDERVVDSLLGRAAAVGAEAIVVTLDTTMLGWRPQDLNLGSLPFGRGEGIAQYTSDPAFMGLVRERVAAAAASGAERPAVKVTAAAVRSLLSIVREHPGSLLDNLRSPEPRAAVETFLDTYSNPGLSWDLLATLRERTDLPFLVKGVQHPDDAAKALEIGATGVIVSNHGGRQVDNAIASLDALVDVRGALGPEPTVLFDSGVRTGADLFTALALGADAVLLGRPYMYGLALAGQRGVEDVVTNVLAELDLTLGLTGVGSVAELSREVLRRVKG